MKKTIIFVVIFAIIFTAFSSIVMTADSSQDLQTSIQKKDIKTIQKMVNELVLQNDVNNYNILIKALDSLGNPPEVQSYMIIITGIACFTNQEVISKLTTFILNNKDKNVGMDMLAAMKNNRTSPVIPLLKDILEKGGRQMQLEVIHQLGSIYSKDSLELLFNYLKTLKPDDKELIKDIIKVLKNITAIDRGHYPETWIQWWEENKNKNAADIIKPPGSDTSYSNVGDYRDMTEVKTIPPMKVIVIRNDLCDKHRWDRNYDKIEDILSQLGIEHTVVGKSELDKESYSLDDKWAILYNCNNFRDACCCPTCKPGDGSSMRLHPCTGCDKHNTHGTKLSDKTIVKIKNFVETGGYLFTEDWAIEEIIERAFKGIIVHSSYLPGKTVPILPAPGATLHPYLKYVFEAPPSDTPPVSSTGKSSETRSVKPEETTYRVNAEWKIDADSPDIKVLKKDMVTVLIVSPKLSNAKSKDEGAVVVTWGFSDKSIVLTDGKKSASYTPGGRVLHVMSHFGKQKSKLDEFALQNLLLNFLTELSERRKR
ncbi:MAG: hypothetical protein V1709_04530 [Planctomycetota bacterium]